MNTLFIFSVSLAFFVIGESCKKGKDDNNTNNPPPATPAGAFYFGADLSYVNQILDHGGVYKDGGMTRTPYQVFKNHGANLVRVRLWHNPVWTKTVYSPPGQKMYNDLQDVEKTIALAKGQGMEVELDFHYSDSWADPGKQEAPNAWKTIRDVNVLKDSIYQYTLQTLQYLNSKGLMPEWVQIGNEINCGMFFTNAPSGFPTCNSCNGDWQKLGEILNSNGLSISMLRKGKKAFTIGRDATPTISSILTGSDDIQVDSVTQAAKLGKDIITKKSEQ